MSAAAQASSALPTEDVLNVHKLSGWLHQKRVHGKRSGGNDGAGGGESAR